MSSANSGVLFARFGIESNKIKKNKTSYKLFEPKKDMTLSVQNIDDLDCPQIKVIGESVAKENNKTLYGWARFTRSLVEDINLILCIDNIPHDGHAIISGWPQDSVECLAKQHTLAEESQRCLLETPVRP